MPIANPKLRDDLITSRQETPEGGIFVIKDSATRRFFRFRETEHLITRQLDGSTPLELVQQKLERDFDLIVEVETLQQFVGQLRRLGLLETDQPASVERPAFHRRVASSPLYLRLKAFDPDRLFDRLLPSIGFFFTRQFLSFSAVTILVAVGITIASWNEIAGDLRRLYRFDALLLAWVTLLSVTTLHEFAHGLTCKHFGGRVHEIGFLLL